MSHATTRPITRYLIVGRRRALLFDAGSGTREITGVVTSLTHLPVTVMPSHLHFDHIGGIAPFTSVAMIDLPDTRADVTNGRFTPSRYEYLGMVDGRVPPTFRVTEWVKPGTTIDLGGRVLLVLHVPGHTHSSVALYDAATHQLFAGDFIYPTTLYASCRERASRNIGRRREDYSRRCPPIKNLDSALLSRWRAYISALADYG